MRFGGYFEFYGHFDFQAILLVIFIMDDWF